MAAWAQAAKLLPLVGLKGASTKGAELFLHQTRKMGVSLNLNDIRVHAAPCDGKSTSSSCTIFAGGGGPIAFMHHSKGKPAPPELQGPEFVTYAGLTISKPQADFEHYWSKFIGGLVW